LHSGAKKIGVLPAKQKKNLIRALKEGLWYATDFWRIPSTGNIGLPGSWKDQA
jgi:hypothetical protein